MRVAPEIRISSEEKRQLESFARGRSTPARLVQRAEIVLLAAAGEENQEIAKKLGIARHTVARWRNRYANLGLAGIERDTPRSGRLPTISAERGQGLGRERSDGASDLETAWPQASSCAHLRP
jgi:transposase